MAKYINAEEFLKQYSILTSRPRFMPQSAELETWVLWKREFDRDVAKIVSSLLTEREAENKMPTIFCKNCIHHRYDDEEFQCTVWNCEVKADGYCDRAERILK